MACVDFPAQEVQLTFNVSMNRNRSNDLGDGLEIEIKVMMRTCHDNYTYTPLYRQLVYIYQRIILFFIFYLHILYNIWHIFLSKAILDIETYRVT
mgnify:CR=1 FL=1